MGGGTNQQRSFEDILQEIINNDPNQYGPAPAEKEKI